MTKPRATAAVQIACITHPSHAPIFLSALAVGMLEPTPELMQLGHVQFLLLLELYDKTHRPASSLRRRFSRRIVSYTSSPSR